MSKWVWLLGAPAALLALVTLVTITWPVVGYETPRGHDEDVLELRKGIVSAAASATSLEQRLAGEIKDLGDVVRCGQLDQQLRELLRDRQQRPNDVDLERAIERVRERMGPNGLNCARYL